ncbi:dystrophin-like isoform X2 [Xenia sp. Carnegie-2017]|uniref:dystrophin-like isoform X2 n=1 Tax=Xenia sp. Carnegie-2017 TaxID=2897299 RepID=UPI001F04FD8F|nr:dystrophin-like isoform X2 [Xenia sp. Carnegie-2017]
MHQYCLSTTGPEDVKDFFKVVKNKMKPRKYKNKPPKHLGYLPVQTIMEGANLETPASPPPGHNQDIYNKLGMLADLKAAAEYSTPQKKGKSKTNNDIYDEHKLIAKFCRSLDSSSIPNQPRSPAQILKELAEEEKEDLDKTSADLEDENRTLLEELSQLKSLTTSRDGHQKDRENDVIDEIKLLQQHKARHESRVKVLEDHNRQLQQQLAKLKQLLEQPSEKSTSPITRASSAGSMKRPGYNNDGGVQDPELRQVMDKINTSFPHDRGSSEDSSKKM